MIRKAELSDIYRLGEIHVSGWRSAYRGIIPDKYLFIKHLVNNSTKFFEAQIKDDAKISVYIDDNDQILKGFICTGVSRDQDLNNYQEIYAFYIQPEFINQKIGTQLLEDYLMRNKNKANISLWVLKNNKNAINFYKKFKFLEDGTEKVDDGVNQITEIRMIKNYT